MNCKKWQTLIMRKIDGEINDLENRNLSLHLKACPHCQKLLQELDQIVTGLEEQPLMDLEINPNLELTIMEAVSNIKYRTPDETGIFQFIYAGLGLVFLGVLLSIGSQLTNFGFFDLILIINDGLSQMMNAVTKLEIIYHILRPFVFQELNTLAQWVLAIYKGTLLVSIMLLVRFIYNQIHRVPENNYH